jgi:hypothetical protein
MRVTAAPGLDGSEHAGRAASDDDDVPRCHAEIVFASAALAILAFSLSMDISL